MGPDVNEFCKRSVTGMLVPKQLDKALSREVREARQCKLCGVNRDGGLFGVLAEPVIGKRFMVVHVICSHCFGIIENAITSCKDSKLEGDQ